MGMGNRNAANGSMIAGMGGFGCMLYNATGAATKYEPEAENRHIVAVQALTDTTIRTVGAAWDAPAAVDGLVLTAGNCLYLKAASVTIFERYRHYVLWIWPGSRGRWGIMSLSLMNRINRNNKTGKGDGKNMDRNASVQVKVQQTAQKLLYKICGRKGGLS